MKRVRLVLHRGLAGVMALSLLIDCGGGERSPQAPTTPVVPAPVLTTVSLSAATVQIGQTDTARAAAFDQRDESMSAGAPAWTTASSAIATVSASGVVTGVAPGQTIVMASVRGKQGQATILVVPVAPAASADAVLGVVASVGTQAVALTRTPVGPTGTMIA